MENEKNRFLIAVRKAMMKKRLKPADVAKRSKGKINPTTLTRIFRGAVLKDPKLINILAFALDLDDRQLRTYACLENIDEMIMEYDLDKKDVFPSFKGRAFKMPVFQADLLEEHIDRNGFIKKRSNLTAVVPTEYGTDCYGIYVKNDDIFYHRAMQGEIAVIGPGVEPKKVNWGVAGYKDKIIITRFTIVEKTHYVFETFQPYVSTTVLTKDVRFCHPMIAILRASLMVS